MKDENYCTVCDMYHAPGCKLPPLDFRTIDKNDKGKPRWSLIPSGTLSQIIKVLEFGAAFYQVDNWQGVPNARTRYYDAVMRHVEAWWRGEKNDPETGLPHLAHAATCLLFLMWFDDQEKTMKFRINDLVAAKTNEPKWDMFMITTIDYEHMKIGYYSTDKGVDVFHNVDDVRMIAQWWDDEDA